MASRIWRMPDNGTWQASAASNGRHMTGADQGSVAYALCRAGVSRSGDGSPVSVPHDRVPPPPPWWTPSGDDTGPLPHDPTSETTRLIRVAHASARRRYEEADGIAEAIIGQARQEAAELVREAETDAE